MVGNVLLEQGKLEEALKAYRDLLAIRERLASTILREAQETIVARGLLGHEQDFLDCLHVMEAGMRHFYVRAMKAIEIKAPSEIVDKNLEKAVSIAEKIAPFRHARLSAVKLAGEPNNPLRVYDNASAEELRAEVMRHIARLTDAGVLDLQALLPTPKGGIAYQSAVNGG